MVWLKWLSLDLQMMQQPRSLEEGVFIKHTPKGIEQQNYEDVLFDEVRHLPTLEKRVLTHGIGVRISWLE